MASTSLCNTKIMGRSVKSGLAHFVSLAIYDHNLIKNFQLHTRDQLASKKWYNISLCSMYEKSASRSYDEKSLETANLKWKEKYIL